MDSPHVTYADLDRLRGDLEAQIQEQNERILSTERVLRSEFMSVVQHENKKIDEHLGAQDTKIWALIGLHISFLLTVIGGLLAAFTGHIPGIH